MGRVHVVGTADTKGAELRYVVEQVRAAGAEAVLVDVGTTGDSGVGDVEPSEVARHHPDGAAAVSCDDRGAAVGAMGEALEAYLLSVVDDVGAVLGIGGSGGTALVTRAMRALPFGVPKLMLSTVASGDVAPYVGPSDTAMMYSVADVAGLNRITRTVLANAAHAAAGMALHPVPSPEADDRPAVGVTMFGVTTPAVTQVVELLGDEVEALVFHATGTGGQSMEKLVDSGMISSVLDVTTTEVADLLVGGVFSAGEGRLDAIARSGVPYVGSVGALDMVNFGAEDTVPPEHADRLFHVHNANVTLMRTTPEENRAMGEWIGRKLNACDGPVRFLLPRGGVSMLDSPDQAFWDPDADAALFDALVATVVQTDDRRLVDVDANVNEPEFAQAVVAAWREVAAGDSS